MLVFSQWGSATLTCAIDVWVIVILRSIFVQEFLGFLTGKKRFKKGKEIFVAAKLSWP